MSYATKQIDHAAYQKSLRGKTDAELLYIIRDAGEAMQAMRGHDPRAEGKYADQVHDASTILTYRRRTGRGK